MTTHPAQPTTSESLDVVALLREQMSILENVLYVFATTKVSPKRKKEMRLHLFGVIGRLNAIELALK